MTLTIELGAKQEAVLNEKARARGVSAEEYARLVLEDDLNLSSHHISEVIRDNMQDIPPEVLASLPRDGASEHDHYIYGLPKRDQ